MEKLRFYRETEFKDTEIGKIPKEWKVEKLGKHLREFIRGVSYNKKEVFFTGSDEYISLLRATNLQKSNIVLDDLVYISKRKVKNSQILKQGDIVITTSSGSKNLVGRATYVKKHFQQPTTIGAFLALVRNKKSVDNYYFYYLFESPFYRAHLNNLIAGTNINNLRKEHIENFKIPLPPLSEQKAIAKVLKDFDDLIEVVEKQIENFERIKKGLMEKYFSEGVSEHKEFKETEVGRIPKEWEVVEIRRIGRVVTGKTPPTNNKDYWNGNIQFITPGDISDSPYVFKTERHVSCNWAKQKNLLLPSKTVLIVCIGSTIGKIALTIGDSVTNQQINALLPYDNVDPICLYYILTFHSTRLKYLSGIAAVPIIKKSLFESFKIPLPPLPEQKEIARRLKAVDDLIETKRKEKERIERAKKKTMELLLTGKVRVKSE